MGHCLQRRWPPLLTCPPFAPGTCSWFRLLRSAALRQPSRPLAASQQRQPERKPSESHMRSLKVHRASMGRVAVSAVATRACGMLLAGPHLHHLAGLQQLRLLEHEERDASAQVRRKRGAARASIQTNEGQRCKCDWSRREQARCHDFQRTSGTTHLMLSEPSATTIFTTRISDVIVTGCPTSMASPAFTSFLNSVPLQTRSRHDQRVSSRWSGGWPNEDGATRTPWYTPAMHDIAAGRDLAGAERARRC